MGRNLLSSRFQRVLGGFFVLALLFGASGSVAQVSVPAAGHAHVIAQGVQDLPTGSLQWHLGSPQIDAQNTVTISGGFLEIEEGQVLASHANNDRTLLSVGQAIYASRGNAASLKATSAQTPDMVTIALEKAPVAQSSNEMATDPFTIEGGAFNLQLIRAVLNPGETESFSPANDYQYVILMTTGSAVYGSRGGMDPDPLVRGDVLQGIGDIDIHNNSNEVATYLMAIIGDKISDTPTAVASGRGTLEINFLECPSGWVPGASLADCFYSPAPPNVTVTNIVGARKSVSTDWDAVSTRDGIYTISPIAYGTYLLAVDYNELWDLQKTHFLSGAYTDGLDWYVEVSAANPTPVVQIVLGYVGDGGGTVPDDDNPIWAPGSMGYAMIVQEECAVGQFDAVCEPAITPWNVYLTHQATGETFVLSVEGTFMGNGTWMLIIPAGPYWVEVDDAGWYVEYSPVIEVFPGTESYLYIRGLN